MLLPRRCSSSPSPLIPLPRGEGHSSCTRSTYQWLTAISGSRTYLARRTIFPLPAGEGRGEGESCHYWKVAFSLKPPSNDHDLLRPDAVIWIARQVHPAHLVTLR